MITLYLRDPKGNTTYLGNVPSFAVYTMPEVGQVLKYDGLKYTVLDVSASDFCGSAEIIVERVL